MGMEWGKPGPIKPGTAFVLTILAIVAILLILEYAQ
jgi:hypothetical protein